MEKEHVGHRQRMYERLEGEELLDAELMELLLYAPLPRKNTVEVVHRLSKAFGSPIGALCAPLQRLKGIKGIGENVANFLYAQGLLFREHFHLVYDPFAGEFHLGEFMLRGVYMYRGEKCEVLDIYLLGENGRLVSRHRRTDELNGEVHLDTKWLGKLLTAEEVYGVVMVHNHPKGRANHSTNDEMATRACQMLCSAHGKILCDHIIFSVEGAYSYYQEGNLKEISQEYSVNKMIKDKVVKEREEKAAKLREEAFALLKAQKQKGEKA